MVRLQFSWGQMARLEDVQLTQIESFHLLPLRSMTLTLKSTPIVARDLEWGVT